MKIQIVSNPERAAELLKTNRPVKVGDVIPMGSLVAAKLLAEAPDVFQEVVAIEQTKENVVAGHQEDKLASPGKNKLLKKGRGFKSKD